MPPTDEALMDQETMDLAPVEDQSPPEETGLPDITDERGETAPPSETTTPEPPRKLRVAGMEFDHPEDVHAVVGGLQAEAARAKQLEQEIQSLRSQSSTESQKTQADSEEQRIRSELKRFRADRTRIMIAAQQAGDWDTFQQARDEMEIGTAEVMSALNVRKQAKDIAQQMINEQIGPLLEMKDRIEEVQAIRGNPKLAHLHGAAEALVDFRRKGNLHPEEALNIYEGLRKAIIAEVQSVKPTTQQTPQQRQPQSQAVGESPASGRPAQTRRQASASETESYKNWWKQIRARG